jgi:methylated-DNA-[protein]-cysteine S-methyltransferase
VPLLLTAIATPVGSLNIIADQHVVLAANLSSLKSLKESLSTQDAQQEIKSVSRIPIISDLIKDYFDGDIEALNSLEVRQPGAPFSQAAWKAMKKVKAGSVISYADLAKRAGSPSAVRAAGSACAKNAIVLIVPCHRIVKTGGALGNYAYGLNKKEWLLRHEGAL